MSHGGRERGGVKTPQVLIILPALNIIGYLKKNPTTVAFSRQWVNGSGAHNWISILFDANKLIRLKQKYIRQDPDALKSRKSEIKKSQ